VSAEQLQSRSRSDQGIAADVTTKGCHQKNSEKGLNFLNSSSRAKGAAPIQFAIFDAPTQSCSNLSPNRWPRENNF